MYLNFGAGPKTSPAPGDFTHLVPATHQIVTKMGRLFKRISNNLVMAVRLTNTTVFRLGLSHHPTRIYTLLNSTHPTLLSSRSP